MTTLPGWIRSEVYELENDLQRDTGCRKGLEWQRDSGCRKGLELQRDSRSGFKRKRVVCRMHGETRSVEKN
jgi:hypothetical protein